MSPFVAYHCSANFHRDSIRECGLLARQPHLSDQVSGVYVYRSDESIDHTPKCCADWVMLGDQRIDFVRWADWGDISVMDHWQVAYIGPMTPDPLVINGMILLDSVPPANVTLVTGNN